VNSYKIDENKEAIAVLDINPISKGHIIIIPKKHITSAEELPKQAFSLAKKISKKLKSKLKPKNIKIGNSSFMNHEIINILPVYTSESLNSEKKQAKPEELEELKKILETIPKKPAKKRKIKKPETEEKKLWLPKRFP
jgi:histidine triad (HIT) family protein